MRFFFFFRVDSILLQKCFFGEVFELLGDFCDGKMQFKEGFLLTRDCNEIKREISNVVRNIRILEIIIYIG